LTIARGASAFTVTVTAENQTLAAIADAINESPNNTGVAATVVTGTGGARLTLVSNESGAVNRIVVTQSGGDGGLVDLVYDPLGSGVTNLTPLDPAADATVLIDGFEVKSATNTIDGAVEGLTLELLEANEPGETTPVTVGFSPKSARETIEKFVKSYNALVDSIASVASFDAQTRQSGPLFGDAGVRNIVFQLRRELTASVSGLDGPFDMLNEIGITAGLDGKLSVNSARLDAAFADDFDAVGELFSTEETGLAQRLDGMLEPYLKSSGIFDSRNETFKSLIDDIGERREALSKRLLALQERYTREFNALDGLLAQLQSTSTFLSQQLARLPGVVLFNRE
jgi:flagellar hook-associated protein 2